MAKRGFEERMNALRVLDYIRTYPERHNQAVWFKVEDALYSNTDFKVVKVDSKVCNTTMCVGGTVLWQQEGLDGLALFDAHSSKYNQNKAEKKARKYLGITKEQANPLFFDTDNETAVYILKRIADGKSDILKGTGLEPWGED